MAESFPKVNGKVLDFSSIEIDLGEAGIFTAFSSISYSQSRDVGVMRGTAAEKLGRTRGQLDAEGSLEFSSKQSASDFRKALGAGWMEREFDITVNYTEGDVNITDVLVGATCTGVDNDHSEGTDALGETWELDVMRIEYDGLESLDNELR